LTQEEIVARYHGCCNHQPKNSFSTKSNFPNPIGKCKKEENAIRFLKSILYFIEEKSFFLQIMLGGNNGMKGCKRVEGCESRLVSKFIGKHKYIDIHKTIFFFIDSNFVDIYISSLILFKLDISSA
jgi:hypothetical protein